MYQAAGIFGEFLKGYVQASNQAHQQKIEQVRQLQDMSIKFSTQAGNETDPHFQQMFHERAVDLMNQAEKIRTQKTGLWNLVSKLISPGGKGTQDKSMTQAADMAVATGTPGQRPQEGMAAPPTGAIQTAPQGSLMGIAGTYPAAALPPTTVEGGRFVTPPPAQPPPPTIPISPTTVQGGQFMTPQAQPQAPGAFPVSRFQFRAAAAAPVGIPGVAPQAQPDLTGLSPNQRAQFALHRAMTDYDTAKQTGSTIQIQEARIKAESAQKQADQTANEEWYKKRAEDWAATPDAQETKTKDRNYYNEIYSFLRYGKPIQDRPGKLINITGRDPRTGLRYKAAYDTETGAEIGTRDEIEPTTYEQQAIALIGQTINGKKIENYDQARVVADKSYVDDLTASRMLRQQEVTNARLLSESRQQAMDLKTAAQSGKLTKQDAAKIMQAAQTFAMQMVPVQLDQDGITKTRNAREVNSWMMRYVEDYVGVSWETVQAIRRAGSPEITSEEKAIDAIKTNLPQAAGRGGIPAPGPEPQYIKR
jgi:hypothetical protein